jgi:hypothetical protein
MLKDCDGEGLCEEIRVSLAVGDISIASDGRKILTANHWTAEFYRGRNSYSSKLAVGSYRIWFWFWNITWALLCGAAAPDPRNIRGVFYTVGCDACISFIGYNWVIVTCGTLGIRPLRWGEPHFPNQITRSESTPPSCGARPKDFLDRRYKSALTLLEIDHL